MLRGLNHLTLAVSDLHRSLAFYSGVLGRDRYKPEAYVGDSVPLYNVDLFNF